MNLIIAGDFCPIGRAISYLNSSVSFVDPKIIDLIQRSNISIVNLECPIVNNECYPIDKCGPNLKSDSRALEFLSRIGFKSVTLANNHLNDYGSEGILQTINSIEKNGLLYVGAGLNLSDAERTLYINSPEGVVSIINCCEHEFSIATDDAPGSNPLSLTNQYYRIKEARELSDYVILIVHGGPEHYQLPTPRMQDWYRFFIDCGADAVVNHHQHCISGVESYKGHPIIYGIGNFCFDSNAYREDKWNYGLLASLNIINKKINFDLIPFKQFSNNPHISLLTDDELLKIKAEIEHLSLIIADRTRLNDAYKSYLDSTIKSSKYCFEPYDNKLLSALYRRGILPSLLSKRKILKLQNFLECESHVEKLIYSLKK